MRMPEELQFLRCRTLPVVLAAEAAECGLACLTMIGRFHGHHVDLNGLRQKFPASMSGVNLRTIMSQADQLGFSTRALRADIGAVPKLKLPAILHWDLNHFVVLKSVGAKSAIIHDPARGRVECTLAELSSHFTGVALELFPSPGFAKVEASIPIRIASLWSKLAGWDHSLLLVITISLALQIVAFAMPFQMQFVLDDAIGRNDDNFLLVVALAFGGLALLQAIITALRDWSVQLLGSQLVFQMVGNLMRHLIRLPSSYFEKRHVGDILSRMQSTRAVQDALTQGVITAVIDGLMALVAGVVLFVYASQLAALVFLSVLLLLGTTCLFYPVMRSRTQEAIMATAREQSHVMETVRAATTIKLMGREAERESTWRNLYGKSFNASVSLGRFQVSMALVQNIIIGLQTVAVVYLGAREILLAQGLSVGMLIAFLSFRQTFTDRASSLVTRGFQFRMLGLHIERLGDIVAQQLEVKGHDLAPSRVMGNISLRGVSFRYGAFDPWIFENLGIDIAPGDFIAITGASGGGKSTLLKLMLGLQSPDSGHVLLDGVVANPGLWRMWRSQIGVVAQDDRLLSGTLADNIAFFDPDLNMERVQRAAVAARVHDEIARMPMNYLTLVGDMGSSLSGGQRQRILLARALYRQPRVLILDEGTANLDPVTEDAIADLISGMHITRIVVAHRPALIGRATRVVRVESGQLVDIRSARALREAGEVEG